jgi:hypothetical protein
MTWFPFDEQKCTLKFGSWTNHEGLINMTMKDEEADTSTFQNNAEWQLVSQGGGPSVPGAQVGAHAKRTSDPFEGFNYVDITFEVPLPFLPYSFLHRYTSGAAPCTTSTT